MKKIVNFSRIIVGVLFIISGLIKLNDPVGFSFKLEEYFSAGVLNLPFLEPLALAIALFVVIFEVLLGVFLLLGYAKKFTLWSLLGMIVFFTFLTFYSAYFNKVTDCGCFGDAVKLTPWESFTKDVILLFFILILWLGKRKIKPILSTFQRRFVVLISVLLCVWYANYVLNHLPQIDFRPYKIGNNIQEGMSIPEDAPEAVYLYHWKFNQSGVDKIVDTYGNYPTVEGDFIGVETEEIQKGYEPPIHDFSIENSQGDFTQTLLDAPKVMMVIAYDINKSHRAAFEEIALLANRAKESGYLVVGLTASLEEVSSQLKESYALDFEFFFTDMTALKTIVRSNPAVLILEKGTITQKKHFNDINQIEL